MEHAATGTQLDVRRLPYEAIPCGHKLVNRRVEHRYRMPEIEAKRPVARGRLVGLDRITRRDCTCRTPLHPVRRHAADLNIVADGNPDVGLDVLRVRQAQARHTPRHRFLCAGRPPRRRQTSEGAPHHAGSGSRKLPSQAGGRVWSPKAQLRAIGRLRMRTHTLPDQVPPQLCPEATAPRPRPASAALSTPRPPGKESQRVYRRLRAISPKPVRLRQPFPSRGQSTTDRMHPGGSVR